MPDTADPVAAYLAEVRERSESRVLNPGSLPITHPGVRGLLATAADVPYLLAALEAVLAAHRPTSGGDGKERCAWCREYYGERSIWPCGEYLTIKAKLLGEAGGDSAAARTAPQPPKGSPASKGSSPAVPGR